MEEDWKKDEDLGALPRRIIRTTPTRKTENALSEHRVKIAIMIYFCAQKEK